MKNTFYALILLACVGCGDDKSIEVESLPSPTPTPTTAYKMADGYTLSDPSWRFLVQIEGILSKGLGLVHYDTVIHYGGLSCTVDYTVSNVDASNNHYHLRIQFPSTAQPSEDPKCSEIQGIYWFNLTSDTAAAIEKI